MDIYKLRLEVPCADEFAELWEYRVREVAEGVIETISEQYGKKIGKACSENKDRLIAFSLEKMLKNKNFFEKSSPKGQ